MPTFAERQAALQGAGGTQSSGSSFAERQAMLQAADADIRSATAAEEQPPEPTYAQRQFALGRIPFLEAIQRPREALIAGSLGEGPQGIASALRGETPIGKLGASQRDFFKL